MYCVSLILTSDEWMKIHQAAVSQWPKETLSRAEICRRYVLVGITSLKNVTSADRERLAHELQASMQADNEDKLQL